MDHFFSPCVLLGQRKEGADVCVGVVIESMQIILRRLPCWFQMVAPWSFSWFHELPLVFPVERKQKKCHDRRYFFYSIIQTIQQCLGKWISQRILISTGANWELHSYSESKTAVDYLRKCISNQARTKKNLITTHVGKMFETTTIFFYRLGQTVQIKSQAHSARAYRHVSWSLHVILFLHKSDKTSERAGVGETLVVLGADFYGLGPGRPGTKLASVLLGVDFLALTDLRVQDCEVTS